MARLQGSHPLQSQYSSYFPPAPSKHQPTSDMQKPSIKHNVFKFPLTKNILWDQTPIGPSIHLHPMHTRNISMRVSEAAVRLAHRHALQADVQPYNGFLIGAVMVDPDEEGLTVSLDRFDPGRDVPGRKARLPTARLPADFIVPLTTILGDADISATHTSDDFIAAFKILESSLSTHGSVDPARCLTLRVMCRCHSNADDITLSLHFGAVTMATVFTGFHVKPIPIIPTALARNLMGPLSLSDIQGSYKTGFLSMDETRKLLLLLESDPKTSTIPLIGIWLSGITHMSNPVVWSACLRFLHSSGIQERVCSPNGGFLVVLFTRTSRQPLFYECMVKSEQDPRFMLVGCRENLHVFKHESAKGKPPVEMELTPARSGPSKSLFMHSLAQLTSSQKHQRSSSRRRSSATEESQLVPRPSPKPMLDKSPSVLPSVPELSFISDSFCEPTDRRRNDQVTANVHPQHQPDHVVHRQRLSGQSEVTGINKKMSVNRRRLHGTSKTPPQGQHSTGMKGSDQISKQNRPGPLRALNGQELETARRKGGHNGETHDTVKKNSQQKNKAGKIMTTQSSGYGLHQRHTNRPGQGRHSAPHIREHRSTASSAGNKSGGRLHQQQMPQPMQQPKSSSQKVEIDYQPSHEQPQQRQSEIHSEGIGSVLPSHQPGTPTGHYHSTINSLGNTDVHDHSNIRSHSSSTVQRSITHEGQCYAETSDHHQDDATTSDPSDLFQKTVARHGHSNLMTTVPEGHVPSPLHYQTQTPEGVTVQNAQSNVVGRLGAAITGDQSRELSGLDTKTLEQLKRQEEMIQQLQEQIKLLLQAHIHQPQLPTSTPLGLITPPATPQGAQNLINQPKESPDVHKVHRLPETMQSPPAVVSSSKEHHMRDTSTPEHVAPAKPAYTGVAALGVQQQATTGTSTRQSSQSPVMCSMAVNTGQSLFWSMPVDGMVSHVPGSPPMQSESKIARRASTTSLGPAAMLAPDSTSTPVGTQQSSDALHQTRKVVETVDSVKIGSCAESSRKSSHSPQSSEQHTPSQSPERSPDESTNTFGANLSSPTLGRVPVRTPHPIPKHQM